ncbi:TetR family transcriptional regulator [Mycolicibacterium madagascariense]|uniref:TetR family transcriptional regulator n=1 Tax=Mycolicibacterium madagascariense TaxID=212765 RepID=A0A7I7XB46_9MYCO|nr:TetR/AcrR family transcriptional regulator [Mycolicibacterium madagascariense]MCV7013543.1 TetR/AcrR family transcriptional regulator [Mycolicibacterium madagascariense]BBZ26989.1 TetR family transcriptional regulator [Mycolicibacterium madagascariense]
MAGVDGTSGAQFESGGRGARERILAAARTLFYRDGIHATGVDRIAQHAHVSKRTLFQHFPSKDVLVQAYLADLDANRAIPLERALSAPRRTPRNRLLAIFDGGADGRVRGCPFHNAAVEAADGMPEVHDIVHAHKLAFIDELVRTCADAGVSDPRAVGHQLAVLFEGALALSTTLNDGAPMRYARSAAAVLIDGR